MDINLEYLVSNFKVFVDTCSLMHPEAPYFFNNRLAPVLLHAERQLIIPHKIVHELDKLQKSKDKEAVDSAKKATNILAEFYKHKLIDIRGDKGDPFADNVFQYVFSKFRTQHDLALITQDRALALDILQLRTLQSIRSSKKLIVLKINKNGGLYEWETEQSRVSVAERGGALGQSTDDVRQFRFCSQPRDQNIRVIRVRQLPVEGDHVTVEGGGRVRLRQLLGEGGEGRIFATDSGDACKIYSKNRLTEHRLAKLTLMVARKIDIPGICWPKAMIKNSYNEYVGYLMPLAEGKPMQKTMFVKPLLERYFPNWTRINLVKLSISWLEKIIVLHRYNILIGDINPLNILIKNDQEIFFVDTDSYQVEDFPCPVGMANFTAPEIQGKDFSTFMRTFEHEYFAIATMLFMILLPGKPPYSHQGGGNPVENIRAGEFSYPFGERSNKKTPDGPWRFIWSHLPYKMKEAFYNNFVNQKRMSPDNWLNLMRAYKYALEKGHLDPNGESDKLFPNRFKSVSSHAKTVYDAKDINLESFECDSCGRQFHLAEFHANRMRDLPHKYCRECYHLQKVEETTGDTFVCSDCGEKFLFSISEKKFFSQNGLVPPKRCRACRGNRKENDPTSNGPMGENEADTFDRSNDSLKNYVNKILSSIFG